MSGLTEVLVGWEDAGRDDEGATTLGGFIAIRIGADNGTFTADGVGALTTWGTALETAEVVAGGGGGGVSSMIVAGFGVRSHRSLSHTFLCERSFMCACQPDSLNTFPQTSHQRSFTLRGAS